MALKTENEPTKKTRTKTTNPIKKIDPLEVILWTKLREKNLVSGCNTIAYRKGNKQDISL